jgi:hypothetical protein
MKHLDVDRDYGYCYYWQPTGESPELGLPNLLERVAQRGRIGEITLRLLALELTPDGRIVSAKLSTELVVSDRRAE